MVNRWLFAMVRAISEVNQPLVSQSEAQARAEICRHCPRQTPWSMNCGTCAGAAFRLGLSIRKGRDVKYGDTLMACEVLGEETRVSVHIANLKPSDAEALPKDCWRRQK